MIIQDEHGASWEVAKGDPAWEYVSVLDRARFTKKALPRSVVLTGTLEFANTYDHQPPALALAVECVEYLLSCERP